MVESWRLRDLRWILLGLFCFYCQMPGACAEKHLKLDPPSIVVLFGDPASVNCSTNVTHHQGMGWEATQGTVPKQKNVQLITWSVESIEQWDIQPMCFINIKNQHSETLKITVYKPPERVFLTESNTNVMFEEIVHELQCVVEKVAPARLLNVNWYKGDQLITSEDFPDDHNKFPANQIAKLQILTNRSDEGVQYRCEAVLKLGPEGPKLPPTMTSDPLNITVHYGPEVSNCPDDVHLRKGMSLAGYCIVAGNPFPDSRWERDGLTIDPSFPLNRNSSGEYKFLVNDDIKKSLMVQVIYGPEITCGTHYTVREGDNFDPNCTVEGHPSFEMEWQKDEYLRIDFPITVQKTDVGQYVLIASNVHTSVSHSMEIEVLYPPSNIMELQAARVSVGEDVVLKCASNAKPRPRYDWLYHKTSNVFIKDQDGVSLLNISSAGSENTGTYLCIASNDLGQANLTVRVDVQGAEPWCPLSFNPPRVLLEYGETVNVKCSSNVTEARLRWIFGNSVIDNDTLVINSTSLSDFLDGNLKATCHGDFVRHDDCQRDLAVTIYKRPEKVSIGTVDHAGPMIEGNNYTLRCDVENVAPAHLLTVNWYKGKYNVGNESSFSGTEYLANQTATLTISPSRNDNITSYSCDAELRLGLKSSTTVKSSPFNITVHYKPAIHEKSPQWVPVFHGYSEVLVCKASGYPAPTITWIYNNGKFEGENLTIKAIAGEYTCVASNSVGSDTRVVNVVLKEDFLPLIAGFVAVVVVIISIFFISIYSIYYKNTKMGHYTVEGATPKAQNGNVAQNGKDNTIPMKKILV